VSLPRLTEMKEKGEPIVMVTAYDYPSATVAEAAGVDIVLVGDSAAMVVLGHDSTVPVTMDEMLVMTRAVASAVRRPIVVGDMPFGSYQASAADALRNAARFLKEAGMDAVKVEGGHEVVETVRVLVDNGIAVMAHVGLTPQRVAQLGGFKVQAKTGRAARTLIDDALALEDAGAFSIVLESVPAPVAHLASERLSIPTIGIGAGVDCDGQVLVLHDVLGLFGDFKPKFAKRYADLGPLVVDALKRFDADVRERRFPDAEHSFPMKDSELRSLEESFKPRKAS